MKLLLFHPGVASIACKDCLEFLYNMQTGRRQTYRSGPERTETPYPRLPNVPPPCRSMEGCPKGSPEREHESILSSRNVQTVRFYHQVRATSGSCLTPAERRDPILCRNLALLDRLYRQSDEERQQRLLGIEVARHVASLFGAMR